MIDRKAKSYSVKCPDCGEVRFVSYGQNWNIATGKCSSSCLKCAIKKSENAGRFKEGSVPLGGMSGHTHTQEWKDAMTLRMVENNPFLGKKHTEETKEKMRTSKLGRLGELASNWRGGLVSLTTKIRHSDEYNKWRSDVFKRDGWVCQSCHARGALEAHHIKLFSDIVKDNKIKTIEDALTCNELWDTSNGTTLCKGCHDLVQHRWKNAFSI